MQQIYSENPPPFHMYNLGKVDVHSGPRQIKKGGTFCRNSFQQL